MLTLARRGKCLPNSWGKAASPGVACPQMRNRPRPWPLENAVDQTRAKPCRGRLFALYGELDRRVKVEIPPKEGNRWLDESSGHLPDWRRKLKA